MEDRFRRVFSGLSPVAFERCFIELMGCPVSEPRGPAHVAMDGKTVRGNAGRSGHPLHLVSAWRFDQGLSLGQIAMDEKSNEITTIPLLLGYVYI
ncbi:MAG: ISAs1 family transposase [Burkholderia sp.]